MNYKEIAHIAKLLLSSPARAWEEIRAYENPRRVLTDFVYPMIGLCALATLLGVLFRVGWDGPDAFQLAMTRCCVLAAAQFGGIFLAAYVLNPLGNSVFEVETSPDAALQLCGYAMVVSFLITIITALFPDLSLLGFLFQFYTLYIVWAGADTLMKVPESLRLAYTLVATVVIVGAPALIDFAFTRLLGIIH